LGALFIVVVMFFPDGLAGAWRDHVVPLFTKIFSGRKTRSMPIANGAPAE
jgi:hypothetical protein